MLRLGNSERVCRFVGGCPLRLVEDSSAPPPPSSGEGTGGHRRAREVRLHATRAPPTSALSQLAGGGGPAPLWAPGRRGKQRPAAVPRRPSQTLRSRFGCEPGAVRALSQLAGGGGPALLWAPGRRGKRRPAPQSRHPRPEPGSCGSAPTRVCLSPRGARSVSQPGDGAEPAEPAPAPRALGAVPAPSPQVRAPASARR